MWYNIKAVAKTVCTLKSKQCRVLVKTLRCLNNEFFMTEIRIRKVLKRNISQCFEKGRKNLIKKYLEAKAFI